MEIKVNINFKSIKMWKDSEKRADHVFDRMQLRGIGVDNIIDAVQKGAKTLREDKSVIAEYRWYKVVYRELIRDDTKKIYPITVMEA